VSTVTSIAIPLFAGIGGLAVGAGFSRVTSRNDQRRTRYADALSALDRLTSNPDEEAQRTVGDIGNWLELDSVPVSNAFKRLHKASFPTPSGEGQIAKARDHFLDVATKYSSWRLPQRLWLQARERRR
jgi:hypothetical protein